MKSMQEKGIHNGCSVRIENSVTRDNGSASLGKPSGAELIFNLHLTTTIDSYILMLWPGSCDSQNFMILFLQKCDSLHRGNPVPCFL